jgi:hypothetical protein
MILKFQAHMLTATDQYCGFWEPLVTFRGERIVKGSTIRKYLLSEQETNVQKGE